MTKIENRDPRGFTQPLYKHSGSFTPTPAGAHINPDSGGPISPASYETPMSPHALPIKNGGQG